jgi:hypothetical protein
MSLLVLEFVRLKEMMVGASRQLYLLSVSGEESLSILGVATHGHSLALRSLLVREVGSRLTSKEVGPAA